MTQWHAKPFAFPEARMALLESVTILPEMVPYSPDVYVWLVQHVPDESANDDRSKEVGVVGHSNEHELRGSALTLHR